jgi:hypothetical protein
VKAFTMLAVPMLLFPALPAIAQNLPPSCGPRKQTFSVKLTQEPHSLTPPKPRMAMLVFINSESNCWGCITVYIGLDGKWIGGNKGNSWFAMNVPVGRRHICAYVRTLGYPLRNQVLLTELRPVAGETYFFTTEVFNTAAVPFALGLRSVSPDEGKFLVSQSAHASWAPKTH